MDSRHCNVRCEQTNSELSTGDQIAQVITGPLTLICDIGLFSEIDLNVEHLQCTKKNPNTFSNNTGTTFTTALQRL